MENGAAYLAFHTASEKRQKGDLHMNIGFYAKYERISFMGNEIYCKETVHVMSGEVIL